MHKSVLKEVQGQRKVMIQLEADQVDNVKFKDNQSSIQSKLNRNIKPSVSQKPRKVGQKGILASVLVFGLLFV